MYMYIHTCSVIITQNVLVPLLTMCATLIASLRSADLYMTSGYTCTYTLYGNGTNFYVVFPACTAAAEPPTYVR